MSKMNIVLSHGEKNEQKEEGEGFSTPSIKTCRGTGYLQAKPLPLAP